jgi:hypothetical protein
MNLRPLLAYVLLAAVAAGFVSGIVLYAGSPAAAAGSTDQPRGCRGDALPAPQAGPASRDNSGREHHA